MKGKSLSVQMITLAIAIIAGYSGLFSPSAQSWLGIVAFTLTALLNSPMLSSGDWPAGWAAVMWINNIAGIVLQVLAKLSDSHLVDPVIVNYVIMGINMLLFTFIKDYKTQTSIVR